ncbi:MAG TPA: UxaA family hydrolase [Rhodothermia bacterium]|nr:UxaA family hydrolase [Rhodothermia bacterium]
MISLQGYQRSDGRKGIRNLTLVAYLVECAHHVSREIVYPFREAGCQLIGFPGCYPNPYAHRMMESLCTHPNVGAVLLVSLGCESFARRRLMDAIASTGRPVDLLIIQKEGGTRLTVEKGRKWVAEQIKAISTTERVEMGLDELVVGTICGGSDATSGMTANPAIGVAFDRLSDEGAACIFEETGELIGCEHLLARRCVTPELADEVVASVEKARQYYEVLGHGSFASGNAEGQLTTQEEKSIGAYAKSGSRAIAGLIKPADLTPNGGLYLLDVVPDGEVRFGFPNIVDNAEIAELIACGSHVILFATGRGSVVGSAISPVIKVCGNPETYERLQDDMDVNAGAILTGDSTLQKVGDEIFDQTLAVAAGAPSRSEALGHQEFILTYKSFDPIGPACLPTV